MGQNVFGNVTIQTDRIITMFQGFDLDSNGNGGNLLRTIGGVGERSLTLMFYSRFNQMINFNIEVYGRWINNGNIQTSNGLHTYMNNGILIIMKKLCNSIEIVLLIISNM